MFIDKYWQSEAANEYENLASDLPLSNLFAVDLTYFILDPKDKIILDYGCFQGDSSMRIAARGAKQVIGIDTNPNFIKKAQKKYRKVQSLDFALTTPSGEIPFGLLPDNTYRFDAVAATFLHPVISLKTDLVNAIKAMSNALEENGYAVMLGLHPDSTKGEYNYRNYLHGPPENGYHDGNRFKNKIVLNDSSTIEFYDYYWSNEFIKEIAENVGFTKVEFIGIDNKLPNTYLNRVNHTLENINNKFGVDFRNSAELEAPLYQIIILRKCMCPEISDT